MISPHPIVIVGAGPVGLTLALALLRRGHHVLVFERRQRLADDPRATTIQPPSLEILQVLGVLEAALVRGRRIDALDYWAFDHGRNERLVSLPFSHIHADTPHAYRLHLAQPELCAALFQAVEKEMTGAVHLGEKVIEVSDRGAHVDVVVGGGSRSRRIQASWVCAADGQGSVIRRQLDLPMRRLTQADMFVTGEASLQLDRAIEARHNVRLGDASYVYTDAGWALFMRMRDSIRILYPTDEASSQAGLAPILKALAGEDQVPLEQRAAYIVHQQVAEIWRQGRVVVLGDAAHSSYPVSGTAMNAGLQDAWALAMAMARDEESVDVWERTRRTQVLDRVNAYANTTYKALQAHGLFSRISRDRYLRRMRSDAKAARDHLLRASMLEHTAGHPPKLAEDRLQ